MDDKQKIMAMMVLAEDQQKASQEILDALKDNQKELARAISNIETRASYGASLGVTSTMENIASVSSKAFKDAVSKSEQRLNETVSMALETQDNLRKASAKLGFRWSLIATSSLIACLLVFGLSAAALVGLKNYQVADLIDQQIALEKEIIELEARANDFKDRAGKAKLSNCVVSKGEKGRLCIQIDEKAPVYENGYRIIKGY